MLNWYLNLLTYSLFIGKRLGFKNKNLTAEQLYSLVKEGKVDYTTIKKVEPKKFEDLEYIMRLIFNHDDDKTKI